MKKQDIDFLKNELKNDYLINNYVSITKTNEHTIKVCYTDKVVTITNSIGFAYLISWWCDGSITASQADHITTICRKYNGRF